MKPNRIFKGRSAIYLILNTVNSKIYIGKTKCMFLRCKQYIYDFKHRRSEHINIHMLRAMEKHGFDSFEMYPLEFCEPQCMSERELFWMQELNSVDRNHGYNLRMDSSSGMVTSQETSKKISFNLKSQWANGIRDGHSEKLKRNWANNPNRKIENGTIFTARLTKYKYIVEHESGDKIECNFKELNELGLRSILSTFSRSGADVGCLKGFKITRVVIQERAW